MARHYSIILGNLGNTRDRFCTGYKDNPDTLTMLQRAASIPHVEGIELVGTWDVTPATAGDMAKALADRGKKCASIIPDLFGDKSVGRGSYSSPDAAVRRRSIDYTRQMCDVAGKLGCTLMNIWPGQDGFDYLLTADYMKARDWFRDAIVEIADAYPQIRLALEYKPKEPRCFSLLARMADTLLMCQETGRKNVGVCIDTGHSFAAGENVAEAVVLAARCGKRLMHMHFNDNHGLWDDDMIVGSVHSVCYIELLYWLDRCGYDGWLSMDQYPYREDAAGAIAESIEWLRQFDAILQANRAAIDKLLAAGDAVATSRWLRGVLAR
jgi:xylose isomerase